MALRSPSSRQAGHQGGGDERLEGSLFGARCLGLLDHGGDLLARSVVLSPQLARKFLRDSSLYSMLCSQLARAERRALSERHVQLPRRDQSLA